MWEIWFSSFLRLATEEEWLDWETKADGARNAELS